MCLPTVVAVVVARWLLRIKEPNEALNPTEITCCLELLLDTAQEFANSDCQGGCRAVLSALRHQTAQATWLKHRS